MTQYLTVARPYATALFNNASDNSAELTSWSNVLAVLSYIMQQPVMVQFVNNPKTTAQQKHEVLGELVRQVVAGDLDLLGSQFSHFLSLLIEHNRLMAVSDMLTLYQQLVDKAQQVTEVTVTSAFEIDESDQEKIKAMLAKRLCTKVSASFQTDKSLIGGTIIHTPQEVIDDSIRSKLMSLHQSLNSVKG